MSAEAHVPEHSAPKLGGGVGGMTSEVRVMKGGVEGVQFNPDSHHLPLM